LIKQSLSKNSDIVAVLFDMDGVIVDSIPNHVKAWVTTFKKYGVDLDPDVPRSHEGEKALVTCKWINEKYELGWGDTKCSLVVEEKRSLFRSYAGSHIFPEIVSIIRTLKNSGFKVALVTGSAIVNVRALLSEDLLSIFDICLTAEDYTLGKPHPEPYLSAANKIGLNPEECLVVENAPFGVQSAVAAGCYVVGITTTLAAGYLAEANEIIRTHKQILDVLGLEEISDA
jgi:beta-phosphoglucomutase